MIESLIQFVSANPELKWPIILMGGVIFYHLNPIGILINFIAMVPKVIRGIIDISRQIRLMKYDDMEIDGSKTPLINPGEE